MNSSFEKYFIGFGENSPEVATIRGRRRKARTRTRKRLDEEDVIVSSFLMNRISQRSSLPQNLERNAVLEGKTDRSTTDAQALSDVHQTIRGTHMSSSVATITVTETSPLNTTGMMMPLSTATTSSSQPTLPLSSSSHLKPHQQQQQQQQQQQPKTCFERHEHSNIPKVTPTRRTMAKTNVKVPGRLMPRVVLDRPCQHHSFLTDITDVRKMEKGLLQLLGDFHSGKLQAFGKDCTFEKMDTVREQQEKLARLHFDLNAQLESYNPLSEEGRTIAKDNMAKLMENVKKN